MSFFLSSAPAKYLKNPSHVPAGVVCWLGSRVGVWGRELKGMAKSPEGIAFWRDHSIPRGCHASIAEGTVRLGSLKW